MPRTGCCWSETVGIDWISMRLPYATTCSQSCPIRIEKHTARNTPKLTKARGEDENQCAWTKAICPKCSAMAILMPSYSHEADFYWWKAQKSGVNPKRNVENSCSNSIQKQRRCTIFSTPCAPCSETRNSIKIVQERNYTSGLRKYPTPLREVKSARDTIKSREDEVLNYFLNFPTNAPTESLNSKIKNFRSQLQSVADLPFFMYRLVCIFD